MPRLRSTSTSVMRMMKKKAMPSTAQATIVAHSFSGPLMYWVLKLTIARPRPSGMPPGPSPTIAPTIDAVALILSAVNRYGSAAGIRSFQKTLHRLAAYERINSSARGSGERRPRIMAIVTGKKVG